MHFDIAVGARGVTPHAALVWWTDFRDGRDDHRFLPSTRRILSRDHETVVMEDRAPFFFREKVVAHVGMDRVTFEGENTFSTFTGCYSFEPRGPEGTRVRLVADVHLKRGLRFSQRAAEPIVRAILRADLRHHVKDMTASLSARS